MTTQRDYLSTGPTTFALRSVMDVMVVLFSNLVPWVLDAISKNALIATAN